jgi:transposase
MSPNKRYDAAFKREIAQVYLDGPRTAPEIAAEIGVHANTIYKWAIEYKADPKNSFSDSGNIKAVEASLLKALRRINELEDEVDTLKKPWHSSQQKASKTRF